MARGYVKQAFESTPGNETNSPTDSTKVLYAPFLSFGAQLGPSTLDRDDENRNTDEPVPALEEAHSPSWSAESRMYPDVLGFWLKGLLGAPTTTAGDGIITDPDTTAIPVGAYRHVWTAPFGPSGASPMTQVFNVSYVDESVYFKVKGAATSQLGISSPESGGCRLSVSGPAAYMARQADPSLTAAYESLSIRPFTRANLTLSWLSGSATTQDFEIGAQQGVDMVRSLGIASKFPDVVEKGEGPIVWSGSIPKRHIDADDYDYLKAATGFAATAKWVNDTVIASSYPYKLYVAMSNCQLVSGELDPMTNRRRHGATYGFKATRNSSASVTVTLVNATTSYA